MINKKVLFTTSIYEKLNFLNDEEIQMLLDFIKNNNTSKTNELFSGDVNCTFDPDPNQGFLNNFKEIKDKIQSEILECAELIGYQTNLHITNSWYNVQKEKSKLDWHTHPHSLISGVLFLKCDSDSSKLYFKNPNPFLQTQTYFNNNSDNYDIYSIIPKEGLLLLWPSWLLHGSSEDMNYSKERIAISFNTFFKM